LAIFTPSPGTGNQMSDQVIHWIQTAAMFGMAITLPLRIVAYVRFRMARSKTPHLSRYHLKEYYIFVVFAILTVLLGQIAVRLG
jgi:hypothetical protein